MINFLNDIRNAENPISNNRKLINTIAILFLGIALGTFSKYLDFRQTELPGVLMAINGVLDIGNFLGRFAIWILIALLKKAIIKCMNKRFFLWSVSVWLYSFPFYSDLFLPLSVVAGCSNSFFHISPHLPQLQSLIHLLVLQLLHTFQILYLPTAPVGVPDIFRHQTHYSY